MADRNRKVTLGPLSGNRRKKPESEQEQQNPSHVYRRGERAAEPRPTQAPKNWVSGREKSGSVDRGGPSRAPEQRPKTKLEIVPDRPWSPGWSAQGTGLTLKKNWGPEAGDTTSSPAPVARKPSSMAAGSSQAAVERRTSPAAGETQMGTARGASLGPSQTAATAMATRRTSPAAASRPTGTEPSRLTPLSTAPEKSLASRERSPAASGRTGSAPQALALTAEQTSPASNRGSPAHGRDRSVTPARSGQTQATSSGHEESDASLEELRQHMHELHDQPTNDNADRIIAIMEINRTYMASVKHSGSLEQAQYDRLVKSTRIGGSRDMRISPQQHAQMVKLQKAVDRHDAAHAVLVWYDDHLGRLLFAAQKEPPMFKEIYDEFKSDLFDGTVSRYMLDEENFKPWEGAISSRSRSPLQGGASGASGGSGAAARG